METTEYTPWYTDTYVATGHTFEEWRMLTNGLKIYTDDRKVDRDGDTMTGALALSNNIGENNYLQFPDGTQQFTAGAPEVMPRAWVNFNANVNSSGTADTASTARLIRSSYNVKDVTKIDSGKYQINFVQPLKNSLGIVTGTAYTGFDNSTASATQGGIIHPYEMAKDYAKIVITDPTQNNYSNPNLASVVVFSTNDPEIPYATGSQLRIKLVQWSGDVWRMYGRILNNPGTTPYTYRIVDGYGWATTKINSASDVLLISKNNTSKNYIDLLTVQVFAGTGELLRTYDIARRFNTGANVNGNTTNNFTVTELTGTASILDAEYTAESKYRPDSNNSTIEFTLTLS